jgi:hypothetical protein
MAIQTMTFIRSDSPRATSSAARALAAFALLASWPACGVEGTECRGLEPPCPSGCAEVRSFRYSLDGTCQSRDDIAIGCKEHAQARTLDGPCYRRTSDGALFFGSGSELSVLPGFERCSFEEEQGIDALPICGEPSGD